MNQVFITLILFSIFHAPTWGFGESTENYYLFPRDREVLYLSGVEYNYRFRQIVHGKECLAEQLLLCEIVREVKEDDYSLNISEALLRADLLYIGERHLDQAPKKWVKKLLEEDNGSIKVLALEMFNSSAQKELDLYNQGLMSDEEIKLILEKDWNYQSSGYMEMISAARSNGTRIIGIDHREELAGLGLDFSSELMERDRLMGEVLNKEISTGLDGKMIIYTGKLHAFKSLGEKVKTVADFVRRQHPELHELHYMSFNLRSKNFLTDLYVSQFNDIRDLEGDFLSTNSLLPYFDGVHFFRE